MKKIELSIPRPTRDFRHLSEYGRCGEVIITSYRNKGKNRALTQLIFFQRMLLNELVKVIAKVKLSESQCGL